MSVAEVPVDQIPLTAHQQFLCIFDSGTNEGPFGPRYHVVGAWRIEGDLDVGTMRAALDDVVTRHETLRTVVVRDEGKPHQRILPPSSPEFTVRDLPVTDSAETQIEELLNEVEGDTNSVDEFPLLQAVLGRFGDQDAVLVLNVHHTAADAWAMDRIMSDVAACYAARAEGRTPDLPEAVQYQEYARWEREHLESPTFIAAREYWRERLRGARVTGIRTDRPRSTTVPKATAWHRFTIEPGVVSAVLDLSSRTKCSPFMILLTAYQLFLRELTGVTETVIPTFTPGRAHARFRDTVGSFINFLPLRTDLAGCDTIAEAIQRTRRTCIEAYSHDIPFIHVLEEAPELMKPAMSEDLQVSAFQVVRSPHMTKAMEVGGLRYTKLWRRELSQAVGSDIPDGILWTLHVGAGNLAVGSLGFNSNRFDAGTMSKILTDYLSVLRTVVTAPESSPARF